MKLALLQFAQKRETSLVRIHRKERFTSDFMKRSFTFHGWTAIIRVTQGARCAGTALAGLSFHEKHETFHETSDFLYREKELIHMTKKPTAAPTMKDVAAEAGVALGTVSKEIGRAHV